MGDQKVFVTIMSIFFGKINTALIVYNKSNIKRNKMLLVAEQPPIRLYKIPSINSFSQFFFIS